MKTSVKSVSLASGKGGVGKTLFAANLARLASTRFRCVLIDLDFQNQGCSGLLSRFLLPGCTNAFDILSDSAHLSRTSICALYLPTFVDARPFRFNCC